MAILCCVAKNSLRGTVLFIIIPLGNSVGMAGLLYAILQKVVSYKEGKRLSRKLGAYSYVECSAKTTQGVKEVSMNVIEQLFLILFRKLHCIAFFISFVTNNFNTINFFNEQVDRQANVIINNLTTIFPCRRNK